MLDDASHRIVIIFPILFNFHPKSEDNCIEKGLQIC